MKRTTAVINFSAILAIGSILAVANSVAYSYAGTIDLYLSKTTINYDSAAVQEALTSGRALAEEIVENGSVLLKNSDNTLPIKNNKKVNIFGWGGCDNGFLYQGGGSSEGGYSADKVSLYQAFRNKGWQINESLASAYNQLSYRREGGPDQNQHSVYYRLYEPGEEFYSEERISNAKNFSDTAIIVLSRRATEGDDLPKVSYDDRGNPDYSRTYLALSEREALMVRKVTENFSKVICLFNSSAPLEMGFVDYPKISAAMYIGYPGYYGTSSIVNLLSGDAYPSGHLTDTCAYDNRTAPSFVNSGPDATHDYAGRGGKYTDYAEDIYVGYKWYETADVEGYWDSCQLNIYQKERHGYDAVVQYPFGYGLTYTSFEWHLDGVTREDGSAISNYDQLNANDTIKFKVWVTNNGENPGRDVVQLYYNPPYTKGGIEKSAVNIIDFQKTALLAPGEGQYLTLTATVSDMASYDTYDKNNNGFMGYELDGGNYTLSLRSDSHNVVKDKFGGKLERTFTVPSGGYKIENDPITGTKVENRFTNYKNETSGAVSEAYEPQATYALSIDGNDSNKSYDQGIKYLSRSNFKDTFPKVTATRTMSSLMYDNVFKVHSPFNNEGDIMPKMGSTDTHYTLNDVKGLPYEDKKWEDLISQLSFREMADLSAHGGFGTNAIASIGKPKCNDSDGGTGFTSGVSTGDGGHAIKYPAANILASTFDYREAYKWGNAIGAEGRALNIQGWYAPGCNVHRSPYGGRNFEYFSEDGRVCGIMCAYTVKGCTENGVYAYAKHFAGNDTDEGRNGQFKWMTEQSLREIWAKPLEIATKIGKANATMISVDRIGSVRATGSYALLTSLLRDEWGFRGSTITDYYQAGNVNDLDEGIRAGNDLALNPSGNYTLFEDHAAPSATTCIALQKAAKNILFTYIDTVYRTETATGMDMSDKVGSRNEDNSGTWWRGALTAVDATVGAGLLAWATLSVIFTWVKKKK